MIYFKNFIFIFVFHRMQVLSRFLRPSCAFQLHLASNQSFLTNSAWPVYSIFFDIGIFVLNMDNFLSYFIAKLNFNFNLVGSWDTFILQYSSHAPTHPASHPPRESLFLASTETVHLLSKVHFTKLKPTK